MVYVFSETINFVQFLLAAKTSLNFSRTYLRPIPTNYHLLTSNFSKFEIQPILSKNNYLIII